MSGARLLWAALAVAVLAVTVYYALISGASQPDHRWLRGHNDLFLHAVAFLALTVPLLMIWPLRLVLPLLAVLAALIEGIQFWLPRRTPDWDDLAASLAGVSLRMGVRHVANVLSVPACLRILSKYFGHAA